MEARGRLPKEGMYKLRSTGGEKKVDQQKRKSRKAEGTACVKARRLEAEGGIDKREDIWTQPWG